MDILRYGEQCDFPIHWADEVLLDGLRKGDEMVVLVFALESDIDRRICGKRTALMHASAAGHFNMVKYILERGVDSTLLDGGGNTAEELAVANGHSQVANLIRASQLETWGKVQHLQRRLSELVSNSYQPPSLFTVLELVETKPYADLQNMRTLTTNKEIAWFRATDDVSIGIDRNGQRMWRLYGERIDAVR